MTSEWSGGSLLKLLTRKLYLGAVVHNGKEHPGRHHSIIGRELFDEVQAKIAARSASAGARRRPSPAGKLVGLISDENGNRMSPVRQRKRPKHIRYYVSQATIKREHSKAGSITRVRADRVENLADQKLAELRTSSPDSELVGVVVNSAGLELRVRSPGQNTGETPQVVSVRCQLKLHGGVKRQVGADGHQVLAELEQSQVAMLMRLPRAKRWMDEIEAGTRTSAKEIAEAEGVLAATVMRDFTWLAAGRHPSL